MNGVRLTRRGWIVIITAWVLGVALFTAAISDWTWYGGWK